MDLLKTLNLPAEKIITDSDSLKYYGKDWTTYFDIKASAVLFPTSTEEVVNIVQWARKNKIALVPSGGRTGLSGAACALNNEVIVSFEKMNRVLQFNEIDHILLAGGNANIPGLAKLLQQKLGYRVTIANPFLQMGFSPQIDIKKIENDASSLMVACGLALRSFD